MKRRRATSRPLCLPAGPSGAALLATLGLMKIETGDTAVWDAIISELQGEISLGEAI